MAMLVWTLLFLGLVSLFIWQIQGRARLLLIVRRDDLRNYGTQTFWQRIKNTLIYAFGQKKFFRDDQPAGIMHIIIFWGFVTLGVQVVTMFIRGWFPEFHVPLLGTGILSGPYNLAKDLFEVAVMGAVSIGIYRWGIEKPKRLYGILPAEEKLSRQSHWEAFAILGFIFTIMFSGLLYDAGQLVAAGEEGLWQPVSSWLATFLSGDSELALSVSQTAWWVHNIIVLVFLNLLPRSKHFHIITAIPNVFFGKVEAKGRLPKKDYATDNAIFGRSQPNQFTWKQVLDMFSCTECGRCSSVCPAAATGKPLAPRQFLVNLSVDLYRQQNQMIQKTGTDGAYDVVVGDGKAVIDEVIWSCVACRACEEACPVNIEYVDKIIDIRQHLVQEVARFPSEMNRAFKGLETQSNPWGISSHERAAWAQGFDVPLFADNPNVEYLYYVGCGGSFDPNNKKVTQSFVKVLKTAGVSFGILGTSEQCNGETARRLGNEYLFQTMAEALVANFKEKKVQKVIVNCPHCFNTLKNEYPDFGGQWEVIHAAALIAKLVEQGKVKLEKQVDKKVVYHDSCYYGRFNDIYDEPRNLISKVPGAKLDEMTACRHKGTCCGAGGGRMWMEERKDQRVNIMRTEQALERNPDVIATSCPFCKIMIGSAISEKGLNDRVTVMDVMEIVEQSTKSP